MEKRNFSRVSFNVQAQFEYGGQTIVGEVENLSLKGMLLKTNLQLPPETLLPFKIVLTDADDVFALYISGKVIRQVPGGLGIFFETIDLDSFAHLSKIIEYNTEDPEKVKSELIEYIRKNMNEE